MSAATCSIKGCVLAEHDPRALDLHEGQKIAADAWEMKPSLEEGKSWELDVYAPAQRDMTTAEARSFAAAILQQAELVDQLNGATGIMNPATIAESFGLHEATVRIAIQDGALHAVWSEADHWQAQEDCVLAWQRGELCKHREQVEQHDSAK